jgi:hypothetical protein
MNCVKQICGSASGAAIGGHELKVGPLHGAAATNDASYTSAGKIVRWVLYIVANGRVKKH